MYNRVNWINEQEGTTTPLNAENLNTMDEGIYDLDERVTALEEAPSQANAYKTIKVGDKELVADGADTVEFVAGNNVSLEADEENKTVTISSTGGGGGGGHEMIDTIEDVLTAEKSENKVVNAFTISEFSNVYTEMVGAILTEGNNTVGKWFEEGETWDVNQMIKDDRFIEHEGEQLSFEFDFWIGEAQGTSFKANTQPLHCTGWQWDSTNGGLTVRCAETAQNDITVIIKVTHIREKV